MDRTTHRPIENIADEQCNTEQQYKQFIELIRGHLSKQTFDNAVKLSGLILN